MSKLSEFSRERFAYAQAKRVLAEKYEAKLTFAYNGGLWRAGPELLTLLAVCKGEHAVILDEYRNPVLVAVAELADLAQQRWQEQMNAWLVEYEQIGRTR